MYFFYLFSLVQTASEEEEKKRDLGFIPLEKLKDSTNGNLVLGEHCYLVFFALHALLAASCRLVEFGLYYRAIVLKAVVA